MRAHASAAQRAQRATEQPVGGAPRADQIRRRGRQASATVASATVAMATQPELS